MAQNWRIPVNAEDYFKQEKKKVDIEERRPVIRRASDLVGPGIGPSAVRVTDWSDTLATFNGFYSSLAGAASAPNSTEPFLGFTVMDAAMGGTQVLTGTTSKIEYKRVFDRNPADPEFITWGSWVRERDRVPSMVESTGGVNPTTVGSGNSVALKMPDTIEIGEPAALQVYGASIGVLRPGIYTGYFIIEEGVPLTEVVITHPSLSGSTTSTRGAIAATGNRWFPLTFALTTAVNQNIIISVTHNTGVSESIAITRLALTRTGQID